MKENTRRFIFILGSNKYTLGLEDIFSELTKGDKISTTSCYFEWNLKWIKTEYTLTLTYIPEKKLYTAIIIKDKVVISTLSNTNKQELYKLVSEELKKLGFKEKLNISEIELTEEWFEFGKFEETTPPSSFEQVNFTDSKLYNKLKELIKDSKTFCISKQVIDWFTIESFSYKLANWSEFNENKLKKEMRGLAFITSPEGETSLFTIWFHKFFNYWEGEGENSTINILQREEIVSIDDKLDGSLILVWRLPTWKILAKSKTSISSEQAVKSTEIINQDKKLQEFIHTLLDSWLYPIFEYIGPDNKVVLTYTKSELILTGIRRAKDWTYLLKEEVEKLRQTYIPHIKSSKSYSLTIEEVLRKQKEDKGYEWFVVSLKNGDKIKIKLESYVQLHHTRDEISNTKKIIEMALDEKLDDLRTLFIGDTWILDYISKIESEVFKTYNYLVSRVETEYEKTKDLIKRDFAIYHQKHNKDIFWLLIEKYMEHSEGKKGPDYKDYVKKTIDLKHIEVQMPGAIEN